YGISPENYQAVYTLCNRIRDLQKCLSGDLKEKLAKIHDQFYCALPSTFLTKPEPLIASIPEEVLCCEFVKQFLPESKEKIIEFKRSMKVVYKKANPELYIKILSSWIDLHKIPLRKLPLEQILDIVPYLRYLDLSELRMDMEKFCVLINSC